MTGKLRAQEVKHPGPCHSWDFPGGPVVENLPFTTGDTGLITVWGTEVPHATRELSPRVQLEKPGRHNYREAPTHHDQSQAAGLALGEGREKHVPGGDDSSREGAAGGWGPWPGGGACWELAIRPWTHAACCLLCRPSQLQERRGPPMDACLGQVPALGHGGELGGQVQAPSLPLGEHWGWPGSLILSLCTSKPGAQMEWGVEEGPRCGGWGPGVGLPGTKIT